MELVVLGAGPSYTDAMGAIGAAYLLVENDHALLLDFLGQERNGRLELVLNLNLGDIRVGASLEGQGDAGRAARIRGRVHIEQAVYALHLLLDDLCNRVLDRFG